jgi:hypothetical protein
MHFATTGSSPVELTLWTEPFGAIVSVAVTFVVDAVLVLRSRQTRFTPALRVFTTRSIEASSNVPPPDGAGPEPPSPAHLGSPFQRERKAKRRDSVDRAICLLRSSEAPLDLLLARRVSFRR